MKNSLDIKSISAKFETFTSKLRQYSVLIFIIVFFGIYGFLVFRVNSLIRTEPSDDDVAAKLQTIKSPHVDQSAVDKIEQLKDNSVEVQALFKQARNNPFHE